ncbi:MAG: hypothetical protein Q8O37_08680 [Sulfuricellaceae bacterium]|nr:hypothetical protein [Sulfuricellaceae bacterium]
MSISAPAVGSVLESCRALFDLLDRGDPFQADLSRQVWVFRAHILFTLLPFDSPEIGLLTRLEEIARTAGHIPGAVKAAGRLEQEARFLLAHPENPKHRWIMTASGTTTESAQSDRTRFLSMMAMGRTFGWPKTPEGLLDAPWPVQAIDSRKCLASAVFDRIIIPGTCHYLSAPLFTELFHEGRSKAVDVLVYPGEWFSLRQRLTPPVSTIFRGRLTSRPITCTVEATAGTHDADTADTDASMRDVLWQITHGGEQSRAPGLISARYVLCRDARGLFVPTNAYFLVWRGDIGDEEGQLERIPVHRLAEGDWLVMQPTDMGYRLDIESAEAGFSQKMEEACDWRPALECLLLIASPEEIAEEMLAEGATGVSLAQSLRNWANGSVYGPEKQNELRVLLVILIRHSKLPSAGVFDQYVAEHWKGLQELRGIRHRAGVRVRRDIHRQLSKALDLLGQPSASQSVLLESGVRVQLSQVAALDDQTSWVPASRLMHLQPMKGGRWHE